VSKERGKFFKRESSPLYNSLQGRWGEDYGINADAARAAGGKRYLKRGGGLGPSAEGLFEGEVILHTQRITKYKQTLRRYILTARRYIV
jgi:hypothetical protein